MEKNISWKNVIIAILLSGLLGYIFKGVVFAVLLMAIMTSFLFLVIVVSLLEKEMEKKI